MPVKELTPQQRLEHYSYALINIRSFNGCFICIELLDFLPEEGLSRQFQEDFINGHKELIKRKPDNVPQDCGWFPTKDKAARIKLLQECIDEVTQLINDNGGK